MPGSSGVAPVAALLWSLLLIPCLFVGVEASAGRRHGAPVTLRMRRGLKSSPSAPIYGAFGLTDEWYVNLTVGSPPQVLSCQVDTGSGDLLVYAKGCSTCGPSAGRFDPAASSSYTGVGCTNNQPLYYCESCHNSQCSFSDAYGDGSSVNYTAGFDEIGLAGIKWKGVLGAIFHGTADFEPRQSDGIWGIGPNFLGSMGSTSAFAALFKQEGLYHGFSMCIRNKAPSRITLGTQIPPDVSLTTPLDNTLFYSPNFVGMTVADKPLPNVNPGDYGLPVVDSGTTAVVFPDHVFHALQKATASAAGCYSSAAMAMTPVCRMILEVNACLTVDAASIRALPPMGLTMQRSDNSTWNWPLAPTDYVIACDAADTTKVQFGISPAGSGGSIPVSILGDVAMQVFEVFFDLKKKLFGFRPTKSC